MKRIEELFEKSADLFFLWVTRFMLGALGVAGVMNIWAAITGWTHAAARTDSLRNAGIVLGLAAFAYFCQKFRWVLYASIRISLMVVGLAWLLTSAMPDSKWVQSYTHHLRAIGNQTMTAITGSMDQVKTGKITK